MLGLASITVTFLAGSSAPTPLYGTYQRDWGFSPLTTTVVFAVYAIVLLVALLSAGRLSDHVGRRPLLLAGIAAQALAMLVFADAHGVNWLLAGRVIQGVGTGAALGAVGAAMLDVDASKGAVANATAPGLGTATGSFISALAVQWLPAPTHLVYLAIAGALIVQALFVVRLPESSPRRPGAVRSLRPTLAMPPEVRRPLLAAAPVLFAVWALAGFYASLAPSVVNDLGHNASIVEGGLGLTVLAGVGAATTYALRATPAPRVMAWGAATLLLGVAATMAGVEARSVTLFFLGTAIAGVGFGAGFQGAIRLVGPLARPDQRAGVLSVLYLVSYLGLGLPVVLAGMAVARGPGLLTTTYVYGIAIMALTAIAALVLYRLRAEPSIQLAKEMQR